MPNYYNPYNFYPVSYANQMGYSVQPMPMQQAPIMQQSQTMPPQIKAMEWVEGEVGAKAFQMPAGWPANQPIPLWDSTDTVIWLKSWGPMGIPNPMQKLHYTMPEQQTSYLMSGSSGEGNGNDSSNGMDMSHFATKEDIDSLREEVMKMQKNASGNRSGNQNGSFANNVNSGNENGNRGGNR